MINLSQTVENSAGFARARASKLSGVLSVHDCDTNHADRVKDALLSARFALARGTKITTLNRRKLLIYAVICVPCGFRSHNVLSAKSVVFTESIFKINRINKVSCTDEICTILRGLPLSSVLPITKNREPHLRFICPDCGE